MRNSAFSARRPTSPRPIIERQALSLTPADTTPPNPVTQRPLTNTDIPGNPSDRLTRLGDNPNRPLPEPLIAFSDEPQT